MSKTVRKTMQGLFAAAIWLCAAGLGGTFVLGCNTINLPSSSGSTQTLAIATGNQIRLYTGIGGFSTAGPAPVPAQTISAANVLSATFDFHGNLYYLANNGTAGSDATLFSCTLPIGGLPYPPCTAVGGSPIAGGQWLAIDQSGTAFATSLTSTAGSIISFPVVLGPSVSPTVVYTSGTLPYAYGGIAVDSADTLYVTEQAAAAAIPHDHLFKCSSTCQASSGSQTDITGAITGSNPNSAPSGPLAIGNDGTTLLVGSSNVVTGPAPQTLPVAFVCAAGGSGLSCQADNATFDLVQGADSPFVMTVGIAGNSTNDVYDAILLNDGGGPVTDYGLPFFGFAQAGMQFACSVNPSTCPVNNLPSLANNTAPGSAPYSLAVAPVH